MRIIRQRRACTGILPLSPLQAFPGRLGVALQRGRIGEIPGRLRRNRAVLLIKRTITVDHDSTVSDPIRAANLNCRARGDGESPHGRVHGCGSSPRAHAGVRVFLRSSARSPRAPEKKEYIPVPYCLTGLQPVLLPRKSFLKSVIVRMDGCCAVDNEIFVSTF